jgi:glycogen synthase
MRVLMTADTVGGVWTFAQELACGLLERDICVLLVSFGRKPSASQRKECESLRRRFGRHFRYVASDIALEWMADNSESFARGAALLEREAAVFAPDVVHCNQFCYGALQMDVPRLVTAHSDVLSWAKACRKEPLADTQWLRNYLAQVQAGLTAADAVTAPTQWMLNALGENFELPEQRTVIPNGRAVPPSFNRPRELRAVTAGRLWDEAKGISLLGQVTSPIPIAIAGESEFGTSQGVQNIGTARLLGQLSQLETMELFRDSAIYICPSVYEPFGLSALEAARCGCAVVARDIPSLREVWGDAALYFDSGELLAGILGQLAGNPQLLTAARRRSFERSLTFSRDGMVEMYLARLQQLQKLSTRAEYAA